MRQVKYIVIHCTATPQTTTIKSIQNYWRNNLGWKSPGYHYIVNPNGTIQSLLPIDQISNGVAGYNSNSIHISYIGGVGTGGVPVDNRTDWQKTAILQLLRELRKQFPDAIIQGHRDFPKVHKACPSFDAKEEYKGI
ncbi:N-acetylmuramoyl-L-alanine amidase [Niabella sp. 22666]|uniref:N-acetylmuramoyl-L-alanine amidase n=1 Tax=Niabella sp. 22666 TaxID=3453954 RepID=UPI003F85AB14